MPNKIEVKQGVLPERGFQGIWEKAKKIPGYITKYEAFVLYMVAQNQGRYGNVMEIGSFLGRSSVIIAKALVDLNSVNRLTCIDNFSKVESSKYHLKIDNPRREFERNINNIGLTEYIELIEGDSSEILEKIANPFSFVFIDGAHTKEQIEVDYNYSMRILQKGGVMAIHDYRNENVSQEYTDWIEENIVKRKDSIYILHRNPDYLGNGLLLIQK